jgi:hypothetical protein
LGDGRRAANQEAVRLGHSVDVYLNVYTKTAIGLRKKALDTMESAVSAA